MIGLADSHHISRIRIHPRDPDTAWVAVMGHLYGPHPTRGVYRTTDGGETWDELLSVSDAVGAPGAAATGVVAGTAASIAADAADGEHVGEPLGALAGAADAAGGGGGREVVDARRRGAIGAVDASASIGGAAALPVVSGVGCRNRGSDVGSGVAAAIAARDASAFR